MHSIVVIFSSGFIITSQSQTVKISGRLYDKDKGEQITGGIINLGPDNLVTTSGQTGEYSFSSPPGRKQITTRVIGYKPVDFNFEALSDTVINIFIQVSPYELNEVIVTGDSIKTTEITNTGSFIITPSALREAPRLFSEPDLLKSFQFLPGVVAGKDGSSEIYVRGGTAGQNIILANGCYFFLPGHLLEVVSPFDLDFLEGAELFKDYFPSELGGGASSVISLDFKKPHSNKLKTQLRLGFLSSGIMIESPLKKINCDISAGLKRGNYSLYSSLLKKIVSSDIGDFLPPDKYSFYDGFIRISHNSPKWGNLTFLFFGNYDNGKQESQTTGQRGDTLVNYAGGISAGWTSMVNALQWNLPSKGTRKWRLDLNFNRLSMHRDIYSQTEEFLSDAGRIRFERTSFPFSPTINNLCTAITINDDREKLSYSAGISNRLRFPTPDVIATRNVNDTVTTNKYGQNNFVYEPAAFFSSTVRFESKFELITGLRLSGGFTRGSDFFVIEPRLRLAYNPGGGISPHINYVRLSQSDHSVEGSNAGLRTMLWLPVSKDFGPEISDVYSAGFQGRINKDFLWTLDGYLKKTYGMVDFKPGASFIFDTSFVDMLDRIKGRSYGLEAGIIKRKGNLTGSVSYTYSRSKREWSAPEGLIWIPSGADRPHNFSLALKYHFKGKTGLGLNWVYQSGISATIYMHSTSYGEFFETKNNIRFFDYHRLDISFRQTIYEKKFSVIIDADVYNVYNRKNTFYFKETYDENEKRYYFKNISLFPIMPSVTVTIKY